MASPVAVSARRKMEEAHSRAEEEVKDRTSHHVELVLSQSRPRGVLPTAGVRERLPRLPLGQGLRPKC